VDALTIVARNYLAPARVLTESFLAHHPNGQFFVVIIDALPDEDFGSEPFEVLSPFDIGINRDEFLRMATMYDVTEMATAVKPWALRTLLERTGSTATYLDPDILVLAPLDDLAALAAQHQIVLTPHILAPIPRDGRTPGEEVIMMAGMYNLGYLSVGRGAEPFLEWWCHRLTRWAIVEPGQGLFTDQRWVDFVPSLFPCTIIRDPGYNVAYWNLFERPVSFEDGEFYARSHRLKFFHYSGFDTSLPHVLSKHQGPNPRVLLSDSDALRSLCELVAARLGAAGHGDTRELKYRFGATTSGFSLTHMLRRAYRHAVLLAEENGGGLPPHAFSPDGAFLDWLAEPVVGPIDDRVSRFLELHYSTRADLIAEFPDLHGDSATRLKHWARVDPDFVNQVPPELIPGPNPEPVLIFDRAPLPGVNVIGYFEAELGVGEAGRLTTESVEASGVPLSTFTYRATTSRQSEGYRTRGIPGCPYDVNLLCVNADQTPRALQALGTEFTNSRYTVGMWFWEVEQFPSIYGRAFEVVDEIWAPSPFVASVLEPMTAKPIHGFPLPVVIPSHPTALTRRDVGLPEGHVFLFAFDFLSVFARKNPLALVSAYCEAFSPRDGANLVIKTINGTQRPLEMEALLTASHRRPDIVVRSDYVTSAEMHAMTQLSDCYVSLHRSEGFGLTMAHAMAWGRPTIATGYSGNLAFMNHDNSYLIPCELVPVGPNAPPYPASAVWAEPSRCAAAAMMRGVVDDPAAAAAKGKLAARHIAETRSLSVAAAFVRHRFDQIHSR
jgi:glycosyltransferase involved in cell wall biosynthesis